jgi:hypothetical protein
VVSSIKSCTEPHPLRRLLRVGLVHILDILAMLLRVSCYAVL